MKNAPVVGTLLQTLSIYEEIFMPRILGISDKSNFGNMSTLPTDAVLTLVRQSHNAKRSGLHEDTRWGTPAGLFSFATPKFLPEKPGERRLMIPQPIHDFEYKDFSGTIPEGYGAGTVEKIEESPVVLLKNTPDHILFTRGTTKDSPIYSLRKTKNGNYICTIRSKDEPTSVKFYKKESFKNISLDQVADLIDRGAKVTEKYDGAGALAYLGKHGIEVYGIKPNKEGKHPVYTPYIGGLYGAKVPEDLVGTTLRTELYGAKNGVPIPANETAGLLNSTLVRAIDKKQKGGINLLMAALAVNQNGVDDYNADITDIVHRLNNPAIHTIPSYTGVQAKRLVDAIRSGKDPNTREGVVLHMSGKRPIKAKTRQEIDAIIRGIFKADTSTDERAGGFTYSYPGGEEIVGRVGSGLDRATARDMLQHPEDYIGQTVRLSAQEQYPNTNALRAPSFIAMRAD